METTKKLLQQIPRNKEDFLTIFEKSWRDWLLYPITYLLYKAYLTPNIVTVFGACLIFLSIAGRHYYFISPLLNFWILLIALISDMLDGSMARNHNRVTVLGVWLDHMRDYMWLLWTSYIIYTSNLITFQNLGVLFGITMLYVLVILRYFIINFLKTPKGTLTQKYIRGYTMQNLQADIFGRVHFALWGIAYVLYIFYLAVGYWTLKEIGDVLIYLTIIFGAIQVYDAYEKSFDLTQQEVNKN